MSRFCHQCAFSFYGSVCCGNCFASFEYVIPKQREKLIGLVIPLRMISTMNERPRIDGKPRLYRDRCTVGTNLSAIVGGEVIRLDLGGVIHEYEDVEFESVSELPCSNCSKQDLRNNFGKLGICPRCERKHLHHYYSFPPWHG